MKTALAERLITTVPAPVIAPLSIAIVDDLHLFRECVAEVLDETMGCSVALQVEDAKGLMTSLPSLPPDVYLLSISLPDEGALDLTRWILEGQPEAKVLILGGDSETPTQVLECIEAGAAGYVSRRGTLAELKESLEAVMKGETLCSPRLTHSVFSRLAELSNRRPAPVKYEPVLTARELEILELVADGLSNKEIAKKLIISLHTVKNHIHNILEKLEVGGRYAAVSYAYDRRWLRRRWR